MSALGYEVVWDGTARTSRHLCVDEEIRREPPLSLSPPKGVLSVPAASSGYRIKLVLAVLDKGSAAQAQLVAETGLSSNQVNATVGYLRRTGRVVCVGGDRRHRVYARKGQA